MEEKQGGVDVSSFMLWEGTGDSELDMASVDYLADGDDDDDDAHSCSCDNSYSGGIIHADDHGDDGDEDGGDEGEVVDQDWIEEEEEEDDDEEEEEGEGEVSSAARQQKKATRDSTRDRHLMDEMERSKLFWEACLAS